MSALTTGAILGLAAATAGTQVASAAIQNHASGNAVNAQTDASNKALALQQQVYQQQQQNAQPYQQLGQTALGKLGAMPANTTPFNPNNYRGGAPIPSTPQMGGGPQQAMAGAQPMGGQPNEPQVKLQAPDGSVRMFPASQAQMYIQRGAKVVG